MATNLQFIKQASVSSNSSSISVTDCFSSKYDHYQVILAVDDVDAEVAIEFRMINSSGVNTSSNYDHANVFMRAGSGSTTDGSTEANSKWQYCMYAEGEGGGFCVMNIFNPASSTKYTMMEFQTSTQYLASSTAVHLGRKGFGLLEVAEAHTGIQVYALSSIITVAKLSVYGVL